MAVDLIFNGDFSDPVYGTYNVNNSIFYNYSINNISMISYLSLDYEEGTYSLIDNNTLFFFGFDDYLTNYKINNNFNVTRVRKTTGSPFPIGGEICGYEGNLIENCSMFSNGELLYKIAIASELHFGDENYDYLADTNSFISDINSRGDINLTIINGDITHTSDYDNLTHANSTLSDLDMEWFVTKGNHDVGFSEENWTNVFGQNSTLYLKRNGYNIIILNTDVYQECINDSENDRLDSYLTSNTEPTFIFSHIMLTNISQQGARDSNLATFSGNTHLLQNCQNFTRKVILNHSNIIAYVSGHDHSKNSCYTNNSIVYGTGVNYGNKIYCYDGHVTEWGNVDNGYMILEIYNGSIINKYISLESDSTETEVLYGAINNSGKALTFDGLNNFVYVNGSENVKLGINFTISLSIMDNGKPSSRMLMSKHQNFSEQGASDGTFYIAFLSANRDLRVTLLNNSFSRRDFICSLGDDWLIDQWNTLSLTYNGSLTKVFINGINKCNDTGISGLMQQDNEFPLLLGSYLGVNWFFRGAMDNILISNRTYTDNEVKYLSRLILIKNNDTHFSFSNKEDNLLGGNYVLGINVTDQLDNKVGSLRNTTLKLKILNNTYLTDVTRTLLVLQDINLDLFSLSDNFSFYNLSGQDSYKFVGYNNVYNPFIKFFGLNNSLLINDDSICNGSFVLLSDNSDVNITLTQSSGNQNVFELDGANDFVEIANSVSLNFNQGQSVSLWAKRTGASTDSYGALIDRGGSNYDRNFNLYWTNGGVIAFRVRFFNGTNYTDKITSKSGYNDVNWHHIVGTYNYTNKNIYIYIDNELKNSFNVNSSDGNVTNGSGVVRIGALGYKIKGQNRYLFNGNIDDIMIFNRSLSASDVTILYDLNRYDNETYTDSSLVSFYKAMNLSGNDSVGSNHGVLNGSVKFINEFINDNYCRIFNNFNITKGVQREFSIYNSSTGYIKGLYGKPELPAYNISSIGNGTLITGTYLSNLNSTLVIQEGGQIYIQ